MYKSYYNLTQRPFELSPDPKFLWLGEKHREALAILNYGDSHKQGFILLTGEVGTGKTTLINALVNSLDDDTIVALVSDPKVERIEFFNLVANSFNIKHAIQNKLDFITYFEEFLLSAHRNNKKIFLIIDEAQYISVDILEELNFIFDIDRNLTEILSILLVGQSEFSTILLNTNNLALRETITVELNLEPLRLGEVREYIEYRLKVAGNGREIFTSSSIREIYAFSKGCPRLINIICERALLTGYLDNLQTIMPEVIKECAQELTLPDEAERSEAGAPEPRRREWNIQRRRVVAISSSLLIILSGFLLTSKYHNDYTGLEFSLTKTVQYLDSFVAKIPLPDLELWFRDQRDITQTKETSEVAVAVAAICKKVANLDPVGSGTSFAASLGKLYCFTKVTGAQSPTRITHVWYFEGTEKARVDLAVNSASWRTYSSKIVRPDQLGAWHVNVLDSVGTVLKTLKFEVKP
jgi:type II secretory pathway predicted ATPase ExeA